MRKAKFVIEIIFFNFTDLLHFSTLRYNWSLLVLINFHYTVDPLSADHLAQTIKFFFMQIQLFRRTNLIYQVRKVWFRIKIYFSIQQFDLSVFPIVHCSLNGLFNFTCSANCFAGHLIHIEDSSFIVLLTTEFWCKSRTNKRTMLMILLEIQQTGAFWSPHRWGGWRHPLRI